MPRYRRSRRLTGRSSHCYGVKSQIRYLLATDMPIPPDHPFHRWRQAALDVAATDDEFAARLCNLLEEDRCGRLIEEVFQDIGNRFNQGTAGDDNKRPAVAALDALILALKRVADVEDHAWLGQLPADVRPTKLITFAPLWLVRRYPPHDRTAQKLAQKLTRGNPPRITIESFKVSRERSGVDSSFVWLTFETDEHRLPGDPTAIKQWLGLAHYRTGDLLYRIEFERNDLALFIPSSIDACFYEAWAPPPPGHPWGMTRDLVTGDCRMPESLTQKGLALGWAS